MGAYRPVSNDGCGWFVLVVLGIAAQIGTLQLLAPYSNTLTFWLLPISIVSAVVGFLLAASAMRRRIQRRRERVVQRLHAYGATTCFPLTPEVRETFRPHLEHLGAPFALKDRIANVNWIAYRRDLLVFEHSYLTGSGRTTQEHLHTVVAWSAETSDLPGARLGNLPWVFLARPRPLYARVYRRAFGEDQEIQDPSFDHRWSLHGSRETLLRFLKPEVRAALEGARKGESWFIGYGWAACAYAGVLDEQGIIEFLEYTQSVLRRAT